MSLPTTVSMTKRDGKLINSNLYDKVKLDTLLGSMKEGDQVEVTYEIKHKDASYGQLSRLHASIRAIASETGAGFEDMKLEIKKRCGLVIGDKVMSFGECSKDQISKAIQECIVVGDVINVNLHG